MVKRKTHTAYARPQWPSDWLLSLPRFGVRGVLVGMAATTLAIFAFAQSAASLGLAVPLFRAFGSGFYAVQADMRKAEMQYQRQPRAVSGPRLISAARGWLAQEPTSARSMRISGWGAEMTGNGTAAIQAMQAADRVSRRDIGVRAWIMRDRVRGNDVAGALREFDTMLRLTGTQRSDLLRQLSALLVIPDARSALIRYARPSTPWFPDLVAEAAVKPDAAVPLAQLLLAGRYVPVREDLTLRYNVMLKALADRGRVDLIEQLYPRLPGASRQVMYSLSLASKTDEVQYAPVAWDLLSASDYGAERSVSQSGAAGDGIRGFAAPLTRGVVARKMLFGMEQPARITWRVYDSVPTEQAEAIWRVRCLDVGESASSELARSVNLFRLTQRRLYGMLVRGGCHVAMLELVVAGGSGSYPAEIAVSGLTVSKKL